MKDFIDDAYGSAGRSPFVEEIVAQIFFDSGLVVVAQFDAAAVEELNAVIFGWVMRCAHDSAPIGTDCPNSKAHPRGRNNPEGVNVCSSRGKPAKSAASSMGLNGAYRALPQS